MDKVNILGVNIDKVSVESASDRIMEYIENGDKRRCVFTPNSEIIMAAYRDSEFCKILNSADILTADGIGVVYASRILKNPIESRAAGYDTACSVLSKGAKKSIGVYLFGAKPGVADKAAEVICERYKGIRVVGTADGYFNDNKEKEIIADINLVKPDLLFVCLGAPKQEKWIHKHKDELDFGVCMGIGGSLDVFAGTAKRAPDFYCKHGLEWFYRLVKEPKRAIRMLDLPKFALTVIVHGKKFKQE